MFDEGSQSLSDQDKLKLQRQALEIASINGDRYVIWHIHNAIRQLVGLPPKPLSTVDKKVQYK